MKWKTPFSVTEVISFTEGLLIVEDKCSAFFAHNQTCPVPVIPVLSSRQAAKAVSQALNQVVNCLPGQRDVDHAIRVIAESSQALQKYQVRANSCSFVQLWLHPIPPVVSL